jgi:hypothetical protein
MSPVIAGCWLNGQERLASNQGPLQQQRWGSKEMSTVPPGPVLCGMAPPGPELIPHTPCQAHPPIPDTL